MKSNRFRRISGRRACRSLVVAFAVATAACNYGFQGGGGFPSHIETVYIEPFENQTVQFGLEQQLYNVLVEELPARLGVRTAGREVADAVVRGRVVRYDDAAQNIRAGDGGQAPRVVAHRVQVAAAVEILDVERNVILWDSRGITGEGTYQPDTGDDRAAIQEAITDLVRKIVDGAQSQW